MSDDPRFDLQTIAELATDLNATASDGDLALCIEDLTEARDTLAACVEYIARRVKRRPAA